ncbi:hypothetical protein PIB30_007196 [Stylosanthes scabra]|uniref:Uncharacterized protein n=1 Tax=Stylosanthes scabra TaxID=79078 RepID=A0ABU6U3I5_9FABA|nr:hypothetical protein [Stylosanthes scabra]
MISKRNHPPNQNISRKNIQSNSRCIPLSINVIFEKCLKKDPQKKAIVDELGFGALSYLPNYYLKQKVLMQIFKRSEMIDNTIHVVVGEVEITTEKIGKAFGFKYTGTTYPKRVNVKELSEHDERIFKFFQEMLLPRNVGSKRDTKSTPPPYSICKTQGTIIWLSIYITSSWKKNNTSSVSGCSFAFIVIYFHETHFGKNCRDAEAQPPWVQYWTGKTLWDRMKQEKTMKAVSTKSASSINM